LSILIFVCLQEIGCDELNTQQTVNDKAQALQATADTATVSDTAPQKSIIDGNSSKEDNAIEYAGDQIDPTITVSWSVGKADKEVEDADALSLEIANHLSKPANVKIEVTFGGLLSESVTMDLGTQLLNGSTQTFLNISSDDIPVQTTKGVCAALASITATYDQNGEPLVINATSDNLYYRHKSNYKGLKIFKEEVFLKQFKGEFINIDDFVTDKDAIKDYSDVSLGRVKKNVKDSVYSDVNIKSESGDQPTLIGAGIGEISIEELDRLMKEADNAK
jgi:hypothetical protein